jgi:hypothetical protein
MQIGVAKPTLGEKWSIPRARGLVEHACICVKRQQVATIIRSSPRNLKKYLCIWALEGPSCHQVVCSKQILHHEGSEDVFIHSLTYIEFFDGWAVFQVPAVCHLFRGFDLSAMSERPIQMHTREMVCWQDCDSR